MGCCGCFSFLRKSHRSLLFFNGSTDRVSQDFLLPRSMEGGYSCNGDTDGSSRQRGRSSEEILLARARNGLICREVSVKETRRVTISENEDGNKMVNEYVRECKIGSGSYGKVVLYRSVRDGKQYAIKVARIFRIQNSIRTPQQSLGTSSRISPGRATTLLNSTFGLPVLSLY